MAAQNVFGLHIFVARFKLAAEAALDHFADDVTADALRDERVVAGVMEMGNHAETGNQLGVGVDQINALKNRIA